MIPRIPKHKFSEPRRNLPGRKGTATAEDRFTIAFARAYLGSVARVHPRTPRTGVALAREIPVNGYGIADLVAVAWDPAIAAEGSVEALCGSGQVTARAFECKLVRWKSALSQAVRYRYFAHQSIVVVPEAAAERARTCLGTFRKVKIGLWSFDPGTGVIRILHTPRPATPKSEKYFHHAVGLVHGATRKALPIG